MTMKQNPRVYYEILHYLLNQPQAKDNVQGIAQWWILKEEVDYSVDLISRTLDQLESQGMVVVKTIGGTQKYYQINLSKMDEIRTLLNSFHAE